MNGFIGISEGNPRVTEKLPGSKTRHEEKPEIDKFVRLEQIFEKKHKYLTMPSLPQLLYQAENSFDIASSIKTAQISMDHLLSIDVGSLPNSTIAVPIRYESGKEPCAI